MLHLFLSKPCPFAETVTLRLIPRRQKKVCAPYTQRKHRSQLAAVFFGQGRGCACSATSAMLLQAVKWAGNVVDNEFMNKKSSKSGLLSSCLLQHSPA